MVAKLIHGTTQAAGDHVSNDFMLHINLVLKGNAIPGTEIAAHLEGRGMWIAKDPKQTPIPPMYGIWFLNTATTPYTVISRSESLAELHLASVILPENTPAGTSGNTPEASVAGEIISALRWLADQKSAAEFRTLAEDFRTLTPSTTLPFYRELASERSPLLTAAGIEGLIAANDPEGVILAAAWSEPLPPSLGPSLMAYSNQDPAGVRALGTLALRGSPFEENVAYALRAIHTRETLPALASLLDAKNPEVQSRALSGFCLFVRNAPAITPQSVPSMAWLETRQPAPLLTTETQGYCHPGGTVYPAGSATEYVAFWKSWWSSHQSELEQP